MRSIIRILGSIAVTISFVFFLYGSIKSARSEESGSNKVDMGGGLVVVQDNTDQQRADASFNLALYTGLVGSILLFGSFAMRKPHDVLT